MARSTQTQEIMKVSPELAKTVVKAAIQAGKDSVPPLFWGPPGVGKSAVVREACEEEGVSFIDLRLVQLDPVDLRGLPYTQTDTGTQSLMASFAPPSWLPREGRGVLFLDELPQAQPLVMNAVSELVLDRRIGDYNLPDGWVIVAAGNRRTDRAATQEMPSHLKNRFAHIEVEPSYADWKGWAQEEAKAGRLDPRLISFLDQNQSHLNKFNPDMMACPTSRSWAFVGRLMMTVKDDRALKAMIAGAVGKGMAQELSAFLNIGDDLPTIEKIVADPHSCPVPDEVSMQTSLVASLADTFPPEHAGKLAHYLRRLDPESMMTALCLVVGRKKGDVDKFAKDKDFAALARELNILP